MSQPNVIAEKRVQLTTKAAVTVVGVGVVAIVLRRKFNIRLELAKQAGVDEWLREIHDGGNTILVLTKEMADHVFASASTIVPK